MTGVPALARWAVSLLIATLLAACGADSTSAREDGQSEAGATVPVPETAEIATNGTAFNATTLDLTARGYVEREFSVRGRASRYRIVDAMGTAQRIDSGHPYATRLLVRRPAEAARFNGTVVVEWLNVTTGQDVSNVGVNSGGGLCMFAGYHLDFSPAALCKRYGSRQAYLSSVRAQTQANVTGGLLLPEEAQRTVEEAQAVAFECTP